MWSNQTTNILLIIKKAEHSYVIKWEKNITESCYLVFKSDIKSFFGAVNSQNKYPPPITNQKFKPGIFQKASKLMEKTKKKVQKISGESFNIGKP